MIESSLANLRGILWHMVAADVFGNYEVGGMKKLHVIIMIIMVIISCPVSAATLKRGDSSVQVMKLQQALTDEGYYFGTADGQFGPTTEDAVRKYQEESGVIADGVVNDIQYMNLTFEAIDYPGKSVSDYDYADWSKFARIYEKAHVRDLQNNNYYVQDYIGKKLSDFCYINDNKFCDSDYFGEVLFELANFGEKMAGVPIESEGDLYNYTVVYQDPMPDYSVRRGSADKLTVRLGVIYSENLTKETLPFRENIYYYSTPDDVRYLEPFPINTDEYEKDYYDIVTESGNIDDIPVDLIRYSFADIHGPLTEAVYYFETAKDIDLAAEWMTKLYLYIFDKYGEYLSLPWGEHYTDKTYALSLADTVIELAKYRGVETEILQCYEWIVDFKESHAKIDLVLFPFFDDELTKSYKVLIGYKVFADEQLSAAENNTQGRSEQETDTVELNTQSRYTDSESIKKVQEYLRILGYYKGNADGTYNFDTEIAIYTYKTDRQFKAINGDITDELISALTGNGYEKNTNWTPVSSSLKEIVDTIDHLDTDSYLERGMNEVRYSSLTGYYYRVNKRTGFYLVGSTDTQEKSILLIPDSINGEVVPEDIILMNATLIRGIDPSLDDYDALVIGRIILSEYYTRNGVTYSIDPKSLSLIATYYQ